MSNPSIQVDILIRELRFLPFAHKKLFAERPAEQLLHQWPLYTIFCALHLPLVGLLEWSRGLALGQATLVLPFAKEHEIRRLFGVWPHRSP